MLVSCGQMEDGQCTVHIVKCTREVTAAVVVHAQCAVTEGDNRSVQAQKSFLENDGFSLELNGLEVITEFELDGSNLANARSNFSVHGTVDLQKNVNCLAVEFKGFFKHMLFETDVCLSDHLFNISVLHVDALDDREQSSHITGLER